MSFFFWHYDLEPEFPLSLLEYTTYGDSDRLHWHDYLQIALCTAGSGRYVFTDKEYACLPGDVFVVDNFEHHVAITEPGKEMTFLFAIFLPELIAPPGGREFAFEYLVPFWYDPRRFCNRIEHASPLAQQIGAILAGMQRQAEGKQPGYRHVLDAELRRILAMLMQHYRAADLFDPTGGIGNHVKMQPALTFIREHCLENVTLARVAEQLHLSPSRFRHLFKEVTQIGFKEYVTMLRLSEAKRMLACTDRAVSEVAHQTGWTNVSQFYKAFHRYVSMSPAEYRKWYRSPRTEIARPLIS